MQQASRRQTDSQMVPQSKGPTPSAPPSTPAAAARSPPVLPNRGQSHRPAGMSASPSRLSRMTIQDPQTDDDLDESNHGTADIAEDQSGNRLNRTASSVAEQQGMGATSNPKHQAGAASGFQIQLTGNAGAGAKPQDRSVRSSSDISSPRGGVVNLSVSGESTSAAVPPWESNSAAAWVKQKSLEKSQSAAAQIADWQQEEEKSRQQESEADKNAHSSPASGKGRALGGLHIQVEEKAPQDGLQEWTESGLDDIAAAVAQYTGASPDELMVTTDDQQDGQLGPKQAVQLRKTGSKQLAQTPRASTGKAHAAQQQQGDAAFNAAAAAGSKHGVPPRYANAQEQMEAELEAAMAADNDSSAAGAATAPVYANAQEQMEAELEAAMAADAGQDAVNMAQSGDPWQQIEQDATRAADNVMGELQ